MKSIKNIFIGAFITLFFLVSCGSNGQDVANETVKIGVQVWASKNLNVAKFRNGDAIREAKTKEEWKEAGDKKQPAWCYYNNDPANGVKYGKLYNWYAVSDPRGLAPGGFHVPNFAEWATLEMFLGGTYQAGIQLKSTQGWEEPGQNGVNSSGFSGLPGGYRSSDGSDGFIGDTGGWWCSNAGDAVYRYLVAMGDSFEYNNSNKNGGFSVRCLKD